MEPTETIKDWQKYRRQSLAALKVQTPMTVLLALGLWGLSRVFPFFVVPMYIVIGVGAFAFVGDAWNVVSLSRKLKQFKSP